MEKVAAKIGMEERKIQGEGIKCATVKYSVKKEESLTYIFLSLSIARSEDE